MTSTTYSRIPEHLRRYIVDQDSVRYSSEDQAVWRYLLRQLRDYLGQHAHPAYREGLHRTGITVDSIPRIASVDEHLEDLGWGAVAVSGFIPPAAFMEFQSLGILPIASDMRTITHLLYTPAPDIVHEAAGHAPFLANPAYSSYLRQYGQVARHAIISSEDISQYEAIRNLSDLKENPNSTRQEIDQALTHLQNVSNSMSFVSEAALLARMNWWTAEYGLVGSLDKPMIFGAGLLSSLGEARSCLNAKVQKIPLSVNCVDYSYDITEPQPQLFVADDFDQLTEVLHEFSNRMAFKVGGRIGLKRAVEAKSVTTVELDSNVQISGRLSEFILGENHEPAYLRFTGPSQLAYEYLQMNNQGVQRHSQGYSTIIGQIKGINQPTSKFTVKDIERLGHRKGQRVILEYTSGVMLNGVWQSEVVCDGFIKILTFSDCRVTLGKQTLYEPAWGEYDLTMGDKVMRVFGGAADRARFSPGEDFAAQKVPSRQLSPEELGRHRLYASLRESRAQKRDAQSQRLIELCHEIKNLRESDWLILVEMLELAIQIGATDLQSKIELHLNQLRFADLQTQAAVNDGLRLATANP